MNWRSRLLAIVLVATMAYGLVATTSLLSPAHANNGGSISFNGTNQYLSLPGSSDWAMGTGDFTVEWFQYQTSFSSSWPRIFTVGTYPSSFGVSIEGGVMYVWLAGGWRLSASVGTISNQWVHFAVVRTGTSLRIYKNGSLLGQTTNSSNVTNSSTALFIGSEGTSSTYFGGLITNFHIVKGTALYTAAFTPAGPITPVADTKLLLGANDSSTFSTDSSSIARTVNVINSAGFNYGTPFPWTGSSTATSVPATAPPATTTTTTTTIAPTTTTVATTTTTLATTTTIGTAPTTTVVVATTTEPPSTTLVPTSVSPPPENQPQATVAPNQLPVAQTTTTTSPRNTNSTALPIATTTVVTTTTTLPPSTTTSVPLGPSNVPDAEVGELEALVNGRSANVSYERLSNELIFNGDGFSGKLSSKGEGGVIASLDEDGSLLVEPGGYLAFELEGLAPGSLLEAWLLSDPLLLGGVGVSDSGMVEVQLQYPEKIPSGQHRLVIEAPLSNGEDLIMALGVVVKSSGGETPWSGVLLAVFGMAIVAGFAIPAVRRRRK
jgi:hypothetical protein